MLWVRGVEGLCATHGGSGIHLGVSGTIPRRAAGCARRASRGRARRGGGYAQRRHHSYMTTAAAALALMDLVEPYWVICTTADAAATASADKPGPS